MHSYRNDQAKYYGPGARLGVLVGGRIDDVFSLGVEVSLDISNLQYPNGPGVSQSEWTGWIAPSILFQFHRGRFELAYGPKIGLFMRRATEHDSTISQTADDQLTGYMIGINGGVFLALSPRTSVGLLLSLDLLFPKTFCETVASPIYNPAQQRCTQAAVESPRVFGLTGAALF
jgi:hypothetical protein